MALLNVVVDISHHNTVSSFANVKNDGIVGVIHKATEGSTIVDNKYKTRRTAALNAGLLWGAYHFGRKGSGATQAKHFLDTVNPQPTDLLVLDFEDTPANQMTLAQAEQFVQFVKDKTGRFPGVYSGNAFINSQLGNNTTTVLKNCFLWIARYSATSPTVPPAWPAFTFWQYTDGTLGPQPHQVNGIGKCDRDKFNGSLANLKALWGV